MKRLLGRTVAALCFCMFLTSAGYGKQLKVVYLKDGGIIECRSFWKEGDKVMVLVNRDVLVDLPRKDVDTKRTFKVHKRSKVLKPAPAQPKAAPATQPLSGEKGTGSLLPPAAAKQKVVSSSSRPAPAAGAAVPVQEPKGVKQAAPAPKKGAPAPVAVPVPRPVPKLHVPPPHVTPAPSSASVAFGMLSFGMLLPFLLLILLLIASFWRIFTKAGEAGWQSIIPLYNMFVLVKISGKPWWWFLLLFVPLVNIVIGVLVQIALAERFDRGVLYGLGLAFLGFLFYPALAFGNATYRHSAY